MNSTEPSQNENTSLEIARDSFKLADRRLGDGNFGTVVLATLKPNVGPSETPVEAIAKKLKLTELRTESTVVAAWLEDQRRVWSSCGHEHVLKFIGYYTENNLTTVYLFSPYLRNGNARKYLEERQSTIEERFSLLKDTVTGLDYLHSLSPPVVHGNLTASNVLINDNHRAVLSDVGLYTLVHENEWIGRNYPMPDRWFSPESFSTSDRTTNSDVWAWGCLALEMMTGQAPFHSDGFGPQLVQRIERGGTPEPTPPPRNWPDGLLELVRKCWSQAPEERPNVRTCLESMNITLSLTKRLHEEVNAVFGSSFIAEERLKPGPDQILRMTGNRTTKTAELSPSGTLVVVKEIKLYEIDSTESRVEFIKRFARQRAALPSLAHEHTLEPIGYSSTYSFDTMSLVTSYMVNGNLAYYMQNEVDMNDKLERARDIMSGLRYLHGVEPPVVHGKITPYNVLINEAGKAVLEDVGWAAIDWHPIASPTASVRWSSPEVNLGDSAVIQSDIWSWACVVLQLVAGELPYSYIQNEDQIKAAMSSRKRGHLTPEPFHELDDVPDELMRLLRRCWEYDSFQRPSAQKCMDTLNSILNTDSDARSGTEGQAVILSSDDDISRFITSVSPQAICINGRFGDVFKGNHKTMGEVALKRLRIGGAALDEQVIRRFEREADTWRRLDHPHVLKFLGTYKPEGHLYFVSPFMQNGTLLEYVNDRPDVNRVKLLCETSDAIGYLHRENIVHGDIKAGNLLISDNGHVLLCDFGLTKSTYAQTSTALKGAGTLRWQSPELWNNEPRTFGSDVYAFAMTIVEVLSGLPPFSHLENEIAVMMAVYQRDERPAKSPTEFNGVPYENAWSVAEACWPKVPGDRISMSEAFRLLKADPSLA